MGDDEDALVGIEGLEARRRGFLSQLLVSHDVCAQSHLRSYGGTGYDFIPGDFAPQLRAAGLADEELRLLCIENSRRALTPAV